MSAAISAFTRVFDALWPRFHGSILTNLWVSPIAWRRSSSDSWASLVHGTAMNTLVPFAARNAWLTISPDVGLPVVSRPREFMMPPCDTDQRPWPAQVLMPRLYQRSRRPGVHRVCAWSIQALTSSLRN